MSSLFLSERNLVIITYLTKNSQEINIESVLDRLLKLANKNILPVSLLILGIGLPEDTEFANKFSKTLFERIDKIRIEIRRTVDALLDTVIDDLQQQILIGNQLNLIEQLEFFKNIINFASYDLDSSDVSRLRKLI